MGSTRYKVTYKCDCGCELDGSCGRRSIFLFEYSRSVDIGTLAHKRHADEPDAKMEYLGSLEDVALSALVEVLTQEQPSESWDKKDEEDFKEARGW